MMKEYVALQIEIVSILEDIVTFSNGDEHEDDIWE